MRLERVWVITGQKASRLSGSPSVPKLKVGVDVVTAMLVRVCRFGIAGDGEPMRTSRWC